MTRVTRTGRWQGAILAGLLAIVAAAPLNAQQERVPQRLYVRPPELVGGPWLNTPKEEPITLKGRIGKVTLVHFWTFG